MSISRSNTLGLKPDQVDIIVNAAHSREQVKILDEEDSTAADVMSELLKAVG